MKPDSGTLTVLQECERSFCALTSHFLENHEVQRWLIAHSGGVDSQFLLYLAKKFLSNLPIVVIHVNHNLQSQSPKWAHFSSQQAELLGLKSIVVDLCLNSTSEEAARDGRYRAFVDHMGPGDCLLQGHHGDDQAETLLFRMLRGSGLKGMLGIPQHRRLADGYLLRPLLDLSRSQIEQASEQLGLEHINDPTNATSVYDRNFLRLKVFPLLRERWPDLSMRWRENTEHLREVDTLLNHYLMSDLAVCSYEKDKLNISDWRALPQVRRPEVLRYWVLNGCGISLNNKQLHQIQSDIIDAPVDRSPVFERKGVQIRRYSGELYLLPKFSEVASETPLQRGSQQTLEDGNIEFEGELPAQLKGAVIRRRKGGERCRPAGLNHSKQVKKLLQEANIPPWYRERWPLIYVGDELAAVPGICICQGFTKENADFSLLWRPFSLSDNS